ncbi:hypothetical protein PI124_g23327 [Phytophthora idaei]|nr:hypothetical protein PI125_g25428 [Phytophthora idaei]KAG3124242.1 hypothetical protein PI126_g23339 [Phytophthora idaei]KAG3231575.1 hypothetical protein PI124_g23327 [Phytophthora idaei]
MPHILISDGRTIQPLLGLKAVGPKQQWRRCHWQDAPPMILLHTDIPGLPRSEASLFNRGVRADSSSSSK